MQPNLYLHLYFVVTIVCVYLNFVDLNACLHCVVLTLVFVLASEVCTYVLRAITVIIVRTLILVRAIVLVRTLPCARVCARVH